METERLRDTDANAEAPSSRATRLSVGWSVIAIVVSIGAGILVGYGLGRGEKVWLVVGAAVFAPIIVAAAHAAGRVESSPRAAAAAAVGLLLLLFIIAVLIGASLWDRVQRQGVELYIPSSDRSAHVYVHAKPEGPELVTGSGDSGPLRGGKPYLFSCQVELGDSTIWVKLDAADYWVPATAMRTANGNAAGPLRRC
jgi:hypothetical protein